MTRRTTTPGPVQPVALLTRIAGLLGLLVAVIAMMRAPPSLSVLWMGPEAGQLDSAEVIAREVWARSAEQEYIEVSPGRNRGGGKTPPRELGKLDVQYTVVATKTGLWVAKDRGDVMGGCGSRGFVTEEEPERMPKKAEEGEPPEPVTPARPMPPFEFWPNSYESYLIPWAKLGPWPRPANPAEKLRATLLAELAAAPSSEIVVLSINSVDEVDFGSLWPVEQVAQDLLRSHGADDAFLVDHDNSGLYANPLAPWQLAGHLPPGYGP